MVKLEPCAAAPRPADNLWAPPPTFADQRAAADNLSARRRCHFRCVYLFCCNFRSMTKRRSSENVEDTTKFFLESLKKFRVVNAARSIILDRRSAAADQN